jgi:hypothetical protein
MKCRICGCTDDHACYDPDLGVTCGWAEPDLCTFCSAAMVSDETFLAAGGEMRPLVELCTESEGQRYIEARRREREM